MGLVIRVQISMKAVFFVFFGTNESISSQTWLATSLGEKRFELLHKKVKKY